MVSPGGAATFVTGLLVPVTNPFIPTDLRTLLAARTGDDRRCPAPARPNRSTSPIASCRRAFGSKPSPTRSSRAWSAFAATSPTAGATRFIIPGAGRDRPGGPRQRQRPAGAALLEAPDGGASLCAGGFNPFGIQPLSPACVAFVNETGITSTQFTQNIAQAYVQGTLAHLPAGDLSLVVGAESRKFNFKFDPGILFGPIAGFNTQLPIDGDNNFFDIFGELFIPILSGQPWAESLDLSLGFRRVRSQATDNLDAISAPVQHSNAYKAELSWQP